MTKLETLTFEYERCGECPNADYQPTKRYTAKCWKNGRVIPNLWGKIPKWCPLPNKEVEKLIDGG